MSIRQAVHHLREVKYFNDPILTGVNHGFVKSIFGIYGGAPRSIFNMLLKKKDLKNRSLKILQGF